MMAGNQGSNPLVTIAITSYNYEQHIGDAIRSALAQTYANLEVLVLDNASTDNSVAVVRSFDDPRIRLIERAENVGIQRNHNDAIREAHGEYILFLSADDVLLPELIADMLSVRHLRPELDMVYSSAVIMDGNGRFQYYFDHPSFDGAESYDGRDEFPNLLTRDNCMHLPTMLFPRAIFQELGLLDEELEILLDYEFAIRMAAAGKRIGFTSKPGVLIRFHGENRSGVKNFVKTGKQLREFAILLQRYTAPQYHQQLAGWGPELAAMVDKKIAEIQQQFPDDFHARIGELQPLIDRARAGIAAVPAVSDAALSAQPKISVIIPFRGRVATLQRALESLREQRYDRWEAIVVTDATFDPSGLVTYMGLADRVRVARMRARRGPAPARNLGIGCATGEIVSYLDEDNRFEPDYLQSVAQAFANANVQVTAARARFAVIADDGTVLGSAETGNGVSPDGTVSRVTNRLALNAVAHRRSCLALTGAFNNSLPLLEDWEFLLRLNSVFHFTALETVACEMGIEPMLNGHHLLGRRTSAAWTEYATRLQELYGVFPPRTQLEADGRTAFTGSLQAMIQRAVNNLGNAGEMLQFALQLSGARETIGVVA